LKVASQIGGEARIPVRNIWHLLLYAWDFADWKGRWKSQAEDSPTLLALLARVLADSVRDLLRSQLGRTFLAHRETIRGIRGRIEFAASLRRLEFHAGRAHCAFPQLDVDTTRNRIIKATLMRLATDARLDPLGSHVSDALRSELRELVRVLGGVTLAPISTADFAKLQLGRNDRLYSVPLAVCRLLHQLQLPTECAGDHAIAALFTDETKMSSVYEAFLRNFYRLHLKNHTVQAEKLSWGEEPSSAYMPEMRTDITITAQAPDVRRLVVDAKFSQTTLSAGSHGSLKFKSDNLYQLYTYLRTQEHMGDAHRVADGMLLYPTVTQELTEVVVIQGHRIQIATVDLRTPWQQIENRLIALAAAR
jgi:5-methylcytosine-specific restriction enzyme subunit McrC